MRFPFFALFGKWGNKNGATERMTGRNEHADIVQLLPISCVFHPKRQHKKKKKHELLLQICQLSGSSTAHGWIRAKAPHTLLTVIKEKRGGCCCCGWVASYILEGGVAGRPNRESQTLLDSLFGNENRVYIGPATRPDLKLFVMGR